MLGDEGDWSQLLVETSKDLVMSMTALPAEIRKFMRAAHAGELQLKFKNIEAPTQLMYRLGHQVIFAAVGIAGAAHRGHPRGPRRRRARDVGLVDRARRRRAAGVELVVVAQPAEEEVKRWLLLLAGCDAVFGLSEAPPTIDGPPGTSACTVGGMHDEDCDGVPDSTDNCPGIANADQANADTDTVGDACDPAPASGGESRLAFYPFDATDSSWRAFGGHWFFATDALVSDDTTSATVGGMTNSTELIGFGVEYDAHLTIEAVPQPDAGQFGLMAFSSGNANDGISCKIVHAASGDMIFAISPGASNMVALSNSKLAAGAAYRVRLTVTPTKVMTCAVDGEQQDGGTVTVTLVSATLGTGRFGAFSEEIGLRIDHLDVIKLAPVGTAQ